MIRRLLALSSLLAFSALGACGSSKPEDGVDTDAEAVSAAASGTSATSLANAKGVTSLFVKEDPTIDPALTAKQNADAVATQLQSSLSACAAASVTHAAGSTTVAVDFGAGCTVGSVGTVSGKVNATVSKTGSTVSVAFTFGPLTVNGRSLTGTASAATSNGTSYMFAEDLLESGNHITFNGTAVLDASGASVTLDGNGTWAQGAAPAIAFTMGGVHHTFAGCYADAGTITETKMVKGLRGMLVTVIETVTFDAMTPSTGNVTIGVNGVKKTQKLPAYGTCPHP